MRVIWDVVTTQTAFVLVLLLEKTRSTLKKKFITRYYYSRSGFGCEKENFSNFGSCI